MPDVSLDLSFCGLAWTFKLLPSNYTQTSVQYATPFTIMLSLRMIKVNKEFVFSGFCVIWYYVLITM